ncbi:MAG: MotA/TolQ/ExbB proton channel family protein [Brevinematales bacterium]|nr:MotA/TolQ/ExbB proton channel family protein [Brevinematales bacterium]
MFGAKNIIEFFQIGGFAMYFLALCSIIALGVFIERSITYYRKSRIKRELIMHELKKAIKNKKIESFKERYNSSISPLAELTLKYLENKELKKDKLKSLMERTILEKETELDRYNSILGTISNVSIYFGLLGTVLGIIKAFESIAVTGASSVSSVIKGVAEALSTTAVGLMIAIPSSIAYNYFTNKVNSFTTEMELIAMELSELDD